MIDFKAKSLGMDWGAQIRSQSALQVALHVSLDRHHAGANRKLLTSALHSSESQYCPRCRATHLARGLGMARCNCNRRKLNFIRRRTARPAQSRLAGWDCQLHPLTIELRDNAAWVRRRILQPEDPEIVKVDRREHRREIRVEKGQAA